VTEVSDIAAHKAPTYQWLSVRQKAGAKLMVVPSQSLRRRVWSNGVSVEGGTVNPATHQGVEEEPKHSESTMVDRIAVRP
jgi:hypothetical protein